jgi:hypothetical protein
VPLVPLGEEADLPREFQDNTGNFRASHRLICVNRGGATVRVERLAVPIEASHILPGAVVEPRRSKEKNDLNLPPIGDHVERLLQAKAERKRKRKQP